MKFSIVLFLATATVAQAQTLKERREACNQEVTSVKQLNAKDDAARRDCVALMNMKAKVQRYTVRELVAEVQKLCPQTAHREMPVCVKDLERNEKRYVAEERDIIRRQKLYDECLEKAHERFRTLQTMERILGENAYYLKFCGERPRLAGKDSGSALGRVHGLGKIDGLMTNGTPKVKFVPTPKMPDPVRYRELLQSPRP